jgi:hypothetical protein
MYWNYSIAIVADNSADDYGIRFYKTLISDTGEELTTVQTTALDARDNAEPGFIDEYYSQMQTVFRNRLEWLIKYEPDVDPRTLPSNGHGSSFGSLLNQALIHAKTLRLDL